MNGLICVFVRCLTSSCIKFYPENFFFIQKVSRNALLFSFEHSQNIRDNNNVVLFPSQYLKVAFLYYVSSNFPIKRLGQNFFLIYIDIPSIYFTFDWPQSWNGNSSFDSFQIKGRRYTRSIAIITKQHQLSISKNVV